MNVVIRDCVLVLFLKLSKCEHLHCVKSARIHSFSGLYFPAFELNTERYRNLYPLKS